MYSFLHKLLADRKGGEIFRLFGAWHIFYVLLTAAAVAAVLIAWRRRNGERRERITRSFVDLAFGLYVLDWFLMPLAYGSIDIEKLPFHACTAMCAVCFLSYRVKPLSKYRSSFALLGLISNLVYLVYPAGVMWHAVHPLSYRVVQTLLFHSAMSVYGILYLVSEHRKTEVRRCYRDLAVVVGMTAWALVGNYAFNGESEGYSHFFNWFFVVRDPFYLLPENVAPFVMPFLNILLFFGVELLIHLAILLLRRIRKSEPRA